MYYSSVPVVVEPGGAGHRLRAELVPVHVGRAHANLFVRHVHVEEDAVVVRQAAAAARPKHARKRKNVVVAAVASGGIVFCLAASTAAVAAVVLFTTFFALAVAASSSSSGAAAAVNASFGFHAQAAACHDAKRGQRRVFRQELPHRGMISHDFLNDPVATVGR